jgi:hypothetical protein
VAFALGKDGDQHIGAGHFIAAGRLNVDHGALNDALEACGGLGFLAITVTRLTEFVVDIVATVRRSASTSTLHACMTPRILVVDQRQKQMLQRRVFMMLRSLA